MFPIYFDKSIANLDDAIDCIGEILIVGNERENLTIPLGDNQRLSEVVKFTALQEPTLPDFLQAGVALDRCGCLVAKNAQYWLIKGKGS